MAEKNAKQLEVFRIQREIAIKIIDYATVLYYHPAAQREKELLKAESIKVKIFFDDSTLKTINQYLIAVEQSSFDNEKGTIYDKLADQLKKVIK